MNKSNMLTIRHALPAGSEMEKLQIRGELCVFTATHCDTAESLPRRPKTTENTMSADTESVIEFQLEPENYASEK